MILPDFAIISVYDMHTHFCQTLFMRGHDNSLTLRVELSQCVNENETPAYLN
jgi:hypothetical protein